MAKVIEITPKKSGSRTVNPGRRLLTLKESAEYLGRSVAGMRELLYQREIMCIQRGNFSKVYIDLRDLDAWIDNNKSFM